MSYIVLGILAALMALFTFVDLRISEALYRPSSFIGSLFHKIGEVPAPLFLTVFCALIFFRYKKLRLPAAAATFLSSYLWAEKIMLFFTLSGIAYYAVAALIMALGSALILFSLRKVPASTLDKLIKLVAIALVFILVNILLVSLTKALFGRIRFRDLSNGAFTPWYVPNGITGHKSFPSGHTTAAAALFALIPICRELKASLKSRAIIYSITFAFVFLTALSRMLLGAHYATDVTFAALLSYSLMLATFHLSNKLHLTKPKAIKS